jgi:hypothetical protein
MTGWDAAQRRILQRLEGLGERAMVRGLKRVGDALIGQYHESIARGRSPRHRFPKLSEPYATRKKRRWGDRPILIASGSMIQSLGYLVTVLGPGRYRLNAGASGTDANGVSNGDKARWHLDGTGRMPARDFGRVPARFLTLELTNALRAEATGSAPVPELGGGPVGGEGLDLTVS